MQREILYDDVFDAQEHYRLLLDSMARPGKINVLPQLELTTPKGMHPAGALLGFSLLNSDVTFHVHGPDGYEAGRYLLVNTSARPVEKEEADFIYIGGDVEPELLSALKVGTLSYPEEGATVIASVDRVANEGEGVVLQLKGPGIPGERILCVAGLDRGFFAALTEINREFPLGIDLILTDGERRIACIPRSSRISFQ